MEKLTTKELISLIDSDMAKEVYAKLVALRMDYEIHNARAFNPESFELCYRIATNTIKKAKMTKIQLFGGIINQSKELESLGFTRQQMLEATGLYMEWEAK